MLISRSKNGNDKDENDDDDDDTAMMMILQIDSAKVISRAILKIISSGAIWGNIRQDLSGTSRAKLSRICTITIFDLFFFLLECDVLRILRSIMRHCYDFDNNNDDDNDNIDDDEEGVLTKT